MSLEGRINVDVLFHDKDGTASLKVVSLQDSRAYTSGKVAIVSGTCGTSAVTFASSDNGEPLGTYRDASGALVSFGTITKIVLKATTPGRGVRFTGPECQMIIPGDDACVYTGADPSGTFTVRSPSGTATYTIVLYGT
jgi:succinyl-CoA synthetase alpha subunit